MPRVKTNQELRLAMSGRLSRLLSIAFDDNWEELAKRLGYANQSTLKAIRDGRVFPDVQRLHELSQWPTLGNYYPSLQWIVAGRGPAVLEIKKEKVIGGLTLEELAGRRAYGRTV